LYHREHKHLYAQHKYYATVRITNINYTIMKLKITQFIALFLLLLVTGIFWGNYFSLSRSFEVFSAIELIHLAKTLVQNLAMPMRIISPACILFMILSAWFYPQKTSKEFYFNIAAILLIVAALVITVVIEVPINNQIIAWTATTIPADWETIRNDWQFFNIIRTFASLLGFAFFAAAILKPFQK
jgi:uncharacterized membrane protein